MINTEKVNQLIDEGYTQTEIAKKTGYCVITIRKLMRKRNVPTTRRLLDKDKLYRLINEGRGTLEIAKIMGCCPDSVSHHKRLIKISQSEPTDNLQHYDYKADLERHKDVWRRAMFPRRKMKWFNRWLQTPDGQRFLYSQMEDEYLRREQ